MMSEQQPHEDPDPIPVAHEVVAEEPVRLVERAQVTPTRPVVLLHGSAALITAAVRKALEQAGQADRAAEFVTRATSGAAPNVLALGMAYVDFQLAAEKKT